jgi:hypothetical protein
LRRQNFPHQFAQPRSPIGFQFQTQATAQSLSGVTAGEQVASGALVPVSLWEPSLFKKWQVKKPTRWTWAQTLRDETSRADSKASAFSQPKPFCTAFG